MDGEEGGIRLSKRFSDKAGSGEVDYKTKAGTAWSHSYLNQKPWHPLSYPNQRRKWIAEQTHSQREKRAEEVAREVNYMLHLCCFELIRFFFFAFSTIGALFCLQYAQEQEFFRQTALVSKKEKEKVFTSFFSLAFWRLHFELKQFSFSILLSGLGKWCIILDFQWFVGVCFLSLHLFVHFLFHSSTFWFLVKQIGGLFFYGSWLCFVKVALSFSRFHIYRFSNVYIFIHFEWFLVMFLVIFSNISNVSPNLFLYTLWFWRQLL